MEFKIGKQAIGEDQPCYVIAEIGNNHQGSLELALEMIEEAAKTGVNAVKLQKRTINDLYTNDFLNAPYNNKNSFGRTYGEHRKFLEFNEEQFIHCKNKAIDCGVELLVTPFDAKSVDFCEELGVNAYKIASADSTNEPLIRYIATKNKPLIISTGASTHKENRFLQKTLESLTIPYAVLYSVSSYPTSYENINLTRIKQLQEIFKKSVVGYSGHEHGLDTSIYAYVLGARIIEKHFTLNKESKGTDNSFSLLPNEFSKLISSLEQANVIMGKQQKHTDQVNSYEEAARYKMGKGVYAKNDIPANTIIEENSLVFKSPCIECTPLDKFTIIGKKALLPIQAGKPILTNNLYN